MNNGTDSRKKISEADSEIHSLRGWMRKLEQSNGSISSRLLAVENRISSIPTLRRYHLNVTGDDIAYTQTDAIDSLDTEKDVSLEPDEHIHQQLSILSKEIIKLNEQVNVYQNHIDEIEQDRKQLYDNLISLEKEYRKRAVIMKVHGREIPLEITGIIGGVIAFLIAGLLFAGGKDIIMSPFFLSCIGCLLIGSSMIRSLRGQSFKRAFIRKNNMIHES
ncbi:MAG: hypothetical protein V1769_03205 [Thermoplasmatota archaeon]